MVRLPEHEHDRIFSDEITPDLFSEARSTDNPTCRIVGGAPGSGKSSMISLNAETGSVVIIPDELRFYHPEYLGMLQKDPLKGFMGVLEDSDRWLEQIFSETRNRSCSVLFESTLRSLNWVKQDIQLFRSNDYKIQLDIAAAPICVSALSTISRYQQQLQVFGFGRAVNLDGYVAKCTAVVDSIREAGRLGLIDSYRIFRNGHLVAEHDGNNPLEVADLVTEIYFEKLEGEQLVWFQEKLRACQTNLDNPDSRLFRSQIKKVVDLFIDHNRSDKPHSLNTVASDRTRAKHPTIS